MPVFVHIADARRTAAIRRNGLQLARASSFESDIRKRGVFALPVTPDYAITHQWLRELKRRGFRTAIGIYFRIADDEPVWCGGYGQPKQPVTAAMAAAQLTREPILGFETIIPRSIAPGEITAIRTLSQTLGWRFYPEAKGQRPYCGCKFCVGGGIKTRRLQQRFAAGTLR